MDLKEKIHQLNKLLPVNGLKWISIANTYQLRLVISYAQPILEVQVVRILNTRSMVCKKESEGKEKKVQISERMKYIIYKSGSVPLLPLLVLTRTIYYVILLLYHWVKCIKPTMIHVSNQYNWKYITSYILYGKKRFKHFWISFRAWTIFKITGINHLGSWGTPLKALYGLKLGNWI